MLKFVSLLFINIFISENENRKTRNKELRSRTDKGMLNTHFRVWVIPMVQEPTVTVKCGSVIKALFLYLNWCPSVMLDSFSYSFTFIAFLANSNKRNIE